MAESGIKPSGKSLETPDWFRPAGQQPERIVIGDEPAAFKTIPFLQCTRHQVNDVVYADLEVKGGPEELMAGIRDLIFLGRSDMTGEPRRLQPDQAVTLNVGERIMVDNQQFYILKEENGELFLERETVRPQLMLSGREDFKEIIIKGEDLKDRWIFDHNLQQSFGVSIEKINGKLTVNDEEIAIGASQEIIRENNTFYIIHHRDGRVELVNDAVYQARKQAHETSPAAGGEKWNQKPSEFLAGFGKEAGLFLNTFKPRDWRDAVTLLMRGISEVGGPVGAGAKALLLVSNFVSIGLKEGITFSKINKQIKAAFASVNPTGELVKLGFNQDLVNEALAGDEPKSKAAKLAWKAYKRQTVLGKFLDMEPSSENLVKIEQITAMLVGSIMAVGGILGGKMIAGAMPGSTAWEVLLNRGLFNYLIPRAGSYVGGKVFELAHEITKMEYETTKEAATKEFIEMTLASMSATVTTMVTAGFIFDVGGSVVHSIQAHAAEPTPPPTAVPAQPSKVPSAQPTHTATAIILAEATATQPPPTETTTPVPAMPTLEEPPTPIPPTEAAPPPIDFTFIRGQTIDNPLLQKAADLNLGWGIDLNNDNTPDLQVFWLDEFSGPDAIVDVTDHNHYFRIDDNFYKDIDHNGIIDQGEYNYGYWNLSDFEAGGADLESLDNVSRTDAPNLSGQPGIIDIEADDIVKSGKAGLASPAQIRNFDELPPRFDINGDNQPDFVTETGQLFADNDHNGTFTEGIDTKITDHDLVFDGINWHFSKLAYGDGSMWVRNDDGKLVGVLPNGKTIDLSDTSGTSRLQAQMHQENPAWSPWQLGRQAVVNPDNLPIPVAPTPVTPPAPAPEPEIAVAQPHGEWHHPRDGSPDWGVQSNGERLPMGNNSVPEKVAFEIHKKWPELKPDDVGRAAHLVILENQANFNQPINDDGNNVSIDPVINSVNTNVQIVQVERFLEANADWVFNELGVRLSPMERYQVAKEYANIVDYAYFDPDNDDNLKQGLIQIIPRIEAEHD